MKLAAAIAAAFLIVSTVRGACGEQYDVLIRGGALYDGSGEAPRIADLAIRGDAIAAIGALSDDSAKNEIDATGLAVAPGFINMLSWATDSLLVDGRSMSDILQGVTLEVFGEGQSYGPLTPAMKRRMRNQQGDLKFDVPWTTLGEYLEHLEAKGVSPNVASFVGATSVRIAVLGYEDRPPNEEELDRMRALVREAMQEGALGVGSSLIYAPAFYAETEELIELCKVAAQFGGMYISHMRSEGDRLLEAIDELITISREAGLPAEIYHLKQAGRDNWDKLDAVIEKVEAARAEGLRITADMYTYTAGSTGLDASFPPWMHEGGREALVARLEDAEFRQQMIATLQTKSPEWENLYLAAGPEGILLVGFRNEKLKPLTGKTLAEVARMRGLSPIETAMDLVIEDGSRVGTIYFMMNEQNVRRQIKLPWVSFGSDGGSPAAEGAFLRSNTHPRAYGNFARLLGKYVREEKVVPLEEAIRKLSALPASNLGIERRGRLAPGYFADVVVFDPRTIGDRATFEIPHRYSTGMVHVFVNGVQVVREGRHTGATPGRAVRGRGWKKTGAQP